MVILYIVPDTSQYTRSTDGNRRLKDPAINWHRLGRMDLHDSVVEASCDEGNDIAKYTHQVQATKSCHIVIGRNAARGFA